MYLLYGPPVPDRAGAGGVARAVAIGNGSDVHRDHLAHAEVILEDELGLVGAEVAAFAPLETQENLPADVSGGGLQVCGKQGGFQIVPNAPQTAPISPKLCAPATFTITAGEKQ